MAALMALALTATFGALAAHADEVASDSLGLFLRDLADSTDGYFGVSGARPDTAGLDSALAWALEHPRRYRMPRRLHVSPRFAFNRADGAVWGAGAEAGVGALGTLDGGARFAAGPDDWLWNAGWRRTFERGPARWLARIEGLHATRNVDRERTPSRLATLRALIYGRDHRHYYRREGIEIGLAREATTWRAGIQYRDLVDRPLVTTVGWNLTRQPLSVFENVAAARGRAREFTYDAAWRLPFAPLTAEVEHATSGAAIDSDFEYRRTRVAAGAEFAVGRVASLIPQVFYGRVSGHLVPQNAFYLGGPHTLRSMSTSSIGGSGAALARLDLIGAPDLLELARIPHPAAFPVQGAVFCAIGAVWGGDPYGGPARPGVDWPRREQWLSEAGAAVIWQPGLPDPQSFFRFNFTVPIGPDRPGQTQWTLSYTRPLDLVKPFEPRP